MKENFIFQHSNKDKDHNNEGIELYTLYDNQDYIDQNNNPRSKTDNDRVLAKKITRDDGSIKYMIKRDGSGRLYNPISIYAQNQSRSSTFLDKTCKDFKFRTVNMKIFEYYINFLRTKNLSWLFNAEREAE
jgi:hypothetical protein